jgi:hypothetical protein
MKMARCRHCARRNRRSEWRPKLQLMRDLGLNGRGRVCHLDTPAYARIIYCTDDERL